MAFSTIASLAGSAISTIPEWAGSTVVGEFLTMGFSYLHDRVLPADSEAELNRLQTALPKIKAVMGIAEALKEKDPSTSEWVEQFRQAFEASEDVLDELEYKRLEDMVKTRDEAGGSTSSSKKRKVSALNDDTLERLKKALTMLDQAAAEIENLLRLAKRLRIHDLSDSQQETGKVSRPETTSFLTETEVFGRKVEKEKIIGWLKRPTDARLSSFGIVGVGGLGKTTLAQFAYQEMHGSNHFDKAIWVCVSTNFNVEDIMTKMLGELGENSFSEKPLNALQEALKQKIHLKKLLIILDDIWDEKKMRDWEQLVAPLRFVQQGSKILFTTRMKSVAELLESVIGTEHESLALQGLREQELRLLFQNYAFRQFNYDNHKDLQAIGDQILKMLRGSPLAAKVIGSLLNSNMDHQYWRKFLKHGSVFNLEQAKDVVEILKLSYYHLPANLQVCFRFCSIFPQDHEFDKVELIQMWVCSGFIPQQLCQQKRPEDIGEDYFNHLLRKSFFEYSESYEGKTFYTMHNLMHELAQNVSYGECCRIESNYIGSTLPSTLRHVSVHGSEIDRVSHLENLRSLVIYSCINKSSLNNLMKKPLRLLKIDVECTIELPEEINCLVHLRYLSVHDQFFRRKQFQNSILGSIYNLYHLQVLEFSAYGIETIRITLPATMARLTGLENLTIWDANLLEELLELPISLKSLHISNASSLKSLPATMARLTVLENLKNFGANLLEKLPELPASLRSLDISYASSLKSLPATMARLTVLEYLKILGANLLEELPELPASLRSLDISDASFLKSLPATMVRLTVLENLKILGANLLEELPELPASLKSLHISNARSLKSLPATMARLTGLENLTIWDANLLEELPELPASLRSLDISDASSLKSLPATMVRLTVLKNLKILGANLLEELPELPASLKSLHISNASSLKSLSATMARLTGHENLTICDANLLEELPELPASPRSLDISDASSLKSLPATMVRLTGLENLKILGANLLEELPELPASLRSLDISDASSLKSLPATMARLTGLENLTIWDANLLEELPELPASLRSLDISDASSLKSLPATMARLTGLENLTIWDANLLEELPELPASLRSLDISVASSLKSLLATMARLTGLENLTIWDANLLEELSELPASLRSLDISDASSLKSLPATMVRLTVLENLKILGANLLEELLELPASLKSLHISNARSLKSLPATMARLTGLENLTIWDANLLEELPELPTSLKSLHISNASSLKSLPATMARLTVLENLKFFGANLLEKLPELPASLRSLDISYASSLKSLPATMARLTVLENLKILGANLLEELPELPASPRSLDISDASSLKSLPATMVRLTTLKRLEIRQADLLQELPEFPASLKEKYIEDRGVKSLIKTLSRSYSSEITFNPPGNLIIDGCDKLSCHSFSKQAHGVSTSADWAGSFWQIANLQILDLHNFENLDRLPDMPLSLIEFHIHNVGLTSLPDLYQNSDSRGTPSASSLKSSLRKVMISNCQKLTSLNGFLQQDNDLRSIEHIEVTNCRNLVHLPVGAFGKFVSLQALTISNCPMLMAADNHSNLLPMALKDLSIENCGELDEPLLESVSSLATLTFLSINNCANILSISLENAFGSLSSLSMNAYDKHFEHSSRNQAHGVSQGSNLSSLMISHLEIDHLSLLLIEPLRSLRSVRNLRVWYCSGMEALPEQWFLQNSSTLSWLSIRNASTLKSLLATMERLSSLQWLEIWQADLLRELPELPISLRSLVIRDASSLRSLPATMERLSALEWLEIWKANLLEELPKFPASLKQKYIEGRGVTSQFGMFPRSYLSLS